MKTLKDFNVQPDQTAVIQGRVNRAYLDKYNPSIVHFPAYSISLVKAQIQSASSKELLAYLRYKIKTNPKRPGITAAYKPAVHPHHQIVAKKLATQIKRGTQVKIKLITLFVNVFGHRQLSLMLTKIC